MSYVKRKSPLEIELEAKTWTEVVPFCKLTYHLMAMLHSSIAEGMGVVFNKSSSRFKVSTV